MRASGALPAKQRTHDRGDKALRLFVWPVQVKEPCPCRAQSRSCGKAADDLLQSTFASAVQCCRRSWRSVFRAEPVAEIVFEATSGEYRTLARVFRKLSEKVNASLTPSKVLRRLSVIVRRSVPGEVKQMSRSDSGYKLLDCARVKQVHAMPSDAACLFRLLV